MLVVFLGQGRLRSYTGVILIARHGQVSGLDLSTKLRRAGVAQFDLDYGSCKPAVSTGVPWEAKPLNRL